MQNTKKTFDNNNSGRVDSYSCEYNCFILLLHKYLVNDNKNKTDDGIRCNPFTKEV